MLCCIPSFYILGATCPFNLKTFNLILQIIMDKNSVQTLSLVLYICIVFLIQIIQGTDILKNVQKTSKSEIPEIREPSENYAHEEEYFGNTGYGQDIGYGQSKGYGGGGGGHGHGHGGYGHGAITLDPVSIISLLALGAFLINNILQLLRTNMQTGRSLNVRDIDIPLDLSDWSTGKGSDVIGEHSRILEDDTYGPNFTKFFANVGSLYYLHPKKRNMCIKKVVCNYVNGQQSREDIKGTFRNRIFDFMLSTITRLVAPEIKDRSHTGSCEIFNKYCSDAILKDAKISTENKVYSTVTSIVSNFAFQRLFNG